MNTNDALHQAIQYFGGHTAMSRALDISTVAIYKWKRKGVPPDRALEIEKLTKGAVTRQDLRPDLFGLAALNQ